MIILYALGFLAILWLAGFNFAKLLKMDEIIVGSDNAMMYIVWGFVFLLPVLMILGLVLPMYVLAPIVIVALLVLSICQRQAFQTFWKDVSTNNIRSFFAMFVPITVMGYPQLLRHQLYTVICMNNDFAFYVASIDWLQDHRILSKITYSLEYPFDSLAEYMMVKTRIGTDVVSAFLARVFFLESYQAFPVMIVVAAVLIYAATAFVINRISDNHAVATAVGILASCCGGTLILAMMQYLPQMMGMPILMLSFYYLAQFMVDGKKFFWPTAFMISALLATYAEYAVYMVLFGIIVLVCYLIKKTVNLIDVLKLAGMTMLINPYGTYKAVALNLYVLGKVSDSPSNIDAFNSNMLGIKKLVGNLVGISSFVIKDNGWLFTYGIVFIGVLLATIFILGWFVFDTNAKIFFYSFTFVFALLELYFLQSQGAYQEFKHITSVTCFCFCFMGSVLGIVAKKYRNHNIGALALYVSYGVLVCSIVLATHTPIISYEVEQVVIDDKTMEIESAVETYVPEGEEVEIDDSVSIGYYMAAAYALRDYPVNLNTNSLSYLQYFQTFKDNDPSQYVLFTVDHQDDPGVVIWANDVYKIVERQAY